MLYLTTNPYSLVSYYLTQECQEKIEGHRKVEHSDLNRLLTQGTIFKPRLLLLELKSEKTVPKQIIQSEFNTAYLCLSSLKSWKKLIEEKEWVKEFRISPERYKSALNKSPLLNQEAKEWFWKKFKYSPSKIKAELFNLECRFGEIGTKVPLEIIERFYNLEINEDFIKFSRNIGTPLATDILTKLTSAEIWSLLIGSNNRIPYLFRTLLDENKREKCPEIYVPLNLYQDAVLKGLIDVKIGAILLNQWLIQVGLRRIKGSIKLNYSIDELKKLENYLGF